VVCPSILLAKKKIKGQKKKWTKKEKIVKNRRDRKRSTQGTLNSSIICGAFCLVHISIATFHIYFTPLFIITGARNTYRPATRTSALNIYSTLLYVTNLCAIYTYLFFCVPPKLHIYFRSAQKRTLAILGYAF